MSGEEEGGAYDIEEVSQVDLVELEIEIEYNLRLKGYCVLGADLDPLVLQEALEEIDRLREGFRFVPVQPEAINGILGPQGSGEFCELAYLGAADYGDGPNLAKLQETMGYFGDIASSFIQNYGYTSVMPSMTIAVRGDEPDTHNALNQDTCMGWLSTFKMAKLMLLLFVGPGEGTLELTPYDDDSGTVAIKTEPGMMVILRYDALMRTHACTRNDHTLVRWIYARDQTGPRGWRTVAKGLQRKMPALRELYGWADDKMAHTFGLEDRYSMEGPNVTSSREWELMMHHHFFKKESIPAAVRGIGGHLPGMWDGEVFWKTVNFGVDYAVSVPYKRWDHDLYYDPEPGSWMKASNATHTLRMGRTDVRHGSFIDGIELFDNKFFGLSPMEGKGMDPQQRHILETSYECLLQAGFRKKDLMNAEIAVYVGTTNPEVNYTDQEAGACSGTGSAVAITANRISFQLGLMGPSSSVECGFASASMAILVGITAILPHQEHRLRTGGFSKACNAGGIFFQISPFMWPRFGPFMNPYGRCFSFDESANGHVRSEGVGNLAMLPYAEKIDGQYTVPDVPCFGTLVGRHAVSNGRCASLTAPSGPAQSEALAEACRSAYVSPLDLDGLDCHGIGALLDDSVELTAACNVLRGMKGGEEEVLTMAANKSNLGVMNEASGVAAIIKVLFNMTYANNAPTVHLKALNPHVDMDDFAVILNTEGVAYRERTSFHGVASSGIAGMNVAHIAWQMADEKRVRLDSSGLDREVFSFWPGGGGLLEGSQLPQQGYYVVGSWTRWEQPEEMLQVRPGTFAYTVTLGANRFERFQIWLDGESTRVLHPGRAHGLPGELVLGPADASATWDYTWHIEGRSMVYPYALYNQEGHIGDQYLVTLMVSGKYRAVTWRRVAQGPEAPIDGLVLDDGTYYVASSWQNWELTEMVRSEEAPGLHSADVRLPYSTDHGEFQIVRNRDWSQVFYPMESEAGNSEVLGPDEEDNGLSWRLQGRAGERFRIEFQRTLEGGGDLRKLSWMGSSELRR